MTRPNGFVVVSTESSYSEATSLDIEVLHLQGAGVLTPQRLGNGRYVASEDAHYWVFQIH